ncbi:MAG: glucose-6-phosphate isomerase, partial [Clostridia bacterium]|nr:glucose-6-phosphate isomerase [Clostridia bacterium]
YRKYVVISEGCEQFPDVHFLSGHTMNELIKAEMLATEYALTVKERLNSIIMLPEVNAHTIGELLTFFMFQTAFIGAMLNIDTFNQPGVEEGKNAAYALLGRKGYEKKAEELNSRKIKQEKNVI